MAHRGSDPQSAGTIIITGASRGIGAATALLAGACGYEVCVNYRSHRDAAEAVVSEIREKGGSAEAVCADVSCDEDVARLFRTVDERFAPLTALVNNAGSLEPQTRVEDLDVDRLRRTFATNAIGPFLCTREAIRRMSIRHGGRGGSIVNVSSVASRLGSPNEYVDYAAAKAAVDTLTLGAAKEVATEGIRINGVRPGLVYTDIHESGGEKGRVDRLKSFVPMERGGQPDEIAQAILWLLSDNASYATGSIIDISGGR